MKKMINILIALFVFNIVSCSDKGGESGPSAEEPVPNVFNQMALEVAASVAVTDLQIDNGNVTIHYEQTIDEPSSELVRRWLDLAIATMSFIEAPRTITIFPEVKGIQAATVRIEAGEVASFLSGASSLKEILSKFEIDE